MEITLAIAVFSFFAGVVITGALTISVKEEAYSQGYREGWLDAKAHFFKKLRQIGNQELIDDFVNSLREPQVL